MQVGLATDVPERFALFDLGSNTVLVQRHAWDRLNTSSKALFQLPIVELGCP